MSLELKNLWIPQDLDCFPPNVFLGTLYFKSSLKWDCSCSLFSYLLLFPDGKPSLGVLFPG